MKENISLNPDAQFMTRAITDDGTHYDEFYYNEENELKELMVTEIVKKENIKTFGLVGEEQFLRLDADLKEFDILSNKIEFRVMKDDENLLDIEGRADKFISFTTCQQIIERGVLMEAPIAHTFGYKVQNDNFFARIMISVRKTQGIVAIADITAKEDIVADFEILVNNKVIGHKKYIEFTMNKTNKLEVKLF